MRRILTCDSSGLIWLSKKAAAFDLRSYKVRLASVSAVLFSIRL
jgi:hypothetical protein